ncbi:MAG TPA: hypothetical protein VLX64_03575 [Thermoplasmata archaeon]|nr:hypothetical protein [Thermoplasmata archaeon]
MDAPPRRIAWISPPPEVCTICKEPLDNPAERSSWNGNPAHRDCVRIRMLQRDPAFRDGDEETEAPDDGADATDGILPRDDDDAEFE